MALATSQDVVDRLGRALETAEQAQVDVLLNDAETLLLRRIPTLLTDPAIHDLAVMVEANAVVRVLRNPGGLRQESDGDYSYSIDTRAAAGFLMILDSEWGLFGFAPRGVFAINPYPRQPAAPNPWSGA